MKLPINRHFKLDRKNIPGLLPIIILPLGSFAVLYFATDIIRCRNCALNEKDIIVRNSELELALNAKKTFYSYNKQSVDGEALRRDVLEELRQSKMIENYAKSKNISVSSEELNALYQERVKQNSNEEELLKRIKDLYGLNKEQYLDVLSNDILRSKVQQSLNIPLSEWLKNNR